MFVCKTTAVRMKNCSETRKHCALAVVRRGRKFSPRHRPPSPRRRAAKIQSAGDGHHLHLQTHFGENRCTQFRVIVVTHILRNTRRPSDRPPQTGPITIHCAAKLSAQCNHTSFLSHFVSAKAGVSTTRNQEHHLEGKAMPAG